MFYLKHQIKTLKVKTSASVKLVISPSKVESIWINLILIFKSYNFIGMAKGTDHSHTEFRVKFTISWINYLQNIIVRFC